MKCTAVNLAWVSYVLGLSALPSTAERNLVPTIASTPDVCIERPSEPEWMQNIALRDAYQRVLIQDIHRAQNLESIVQTETCNCATRENHAGAERWEMLQASDTYNRCANELRTQAQTICEAEGNW
jgi:hypothetical protein